MTNMLLEPGWKTLLMIFVWCMWWDVWKNCCMLSSQQCLHPIKTNLPVSQGWLFKLYCVCQIVSLIMINDNTWWVIETFYCCTDYANVCVVGKNEIPVKFKFH